MTGLSRGAVVAFTFASIVAAAPVLVAQQPPQPQIDPMEWQRKYQFGVKHRTASDLYLALKNAAKGGRQSPPVSQLPDWSGIWVSAGGGGPFAPGPGGVMPKMTPAAAARLDELRSLTAKRISYDENLSECGPAGHPRWLREPFLREWVVTPNQTWLINEMVNEIRRIYTDGRDHAPEADRYPIVDGDSIGFWDGPKLVIHTNQLMARSMGRDLPDQSDQMETVEVWEKINPTTIAVDVWMYDPAVYVEPWYSQRRYTLVPNPDKSLRLHYWDCLENANNKVIKTPDGNTQFPGFTFEKPTPKE